MNTYNYFKEKTPNLSKAGVLLIVIVVEALIIWHAFPGFLQRMNLQPSHEIFKDAFRSISVESSNVGGVQNVYCGEHKFTLTRKAISPGMPVIQEYLRKFSSERPIFEEWNDLTLRSGKMPAMGSVSLLYKDDAVPAYLVNESFGPPTEEISFVLLGMKSGDCAHALLMLRRGRQQGYSGVFEFDIRSAKLKELISEAEFSYPTSFVFRMSQDGEKVIFVPQTFGVVIRNNRGWQAGCGISQAIDVYNLKDKRWIRHIQLPDRVTLSRSMTDRCEVDVGWESDTSIYFSAYDATWGSDALPLLERKVMTLDSAVEPFVSQIATLTSSTPKNIVWTKDGIRYELQSVTAGRLRTTDINASNTTALVLHVNMDLSGVWREMIRGAGYVCTAPPVKRLVNELGDLRGPDNLEIYALNNEAPYMQDGARCWRYRLEESYKDERYEDQQFVFILSNADDEVFFLTDDPANPYFSITHSTSDTIKIEGPGGKG